MNNPKNTPIFRFLWILSLFLVFSAPAAQAETYNLVVQPIQDSKQTRKAYQPLAEYLSKITGHEIKLVTAVNYLAYWHTMRRDKKYDLLLDGAHFTDWRIKKLKYEPLVKIASVVSFTLVSHTDNPVLEADELIGKRVAVLSPPSMGSLKLAELFPSPMRQPIIVTVKNSQEAVKMVEKGRAVGAVIPTRMVGAFPFLVTVESMEQMPHMALSASKRVPIDVRNKIRTALLNAGKTDEGKALLEKLVLEGFEPATKKLYDGFSKSLRNTHGY